MLLGQDHSLGSELKRVPAISSLELHYWNCAVDCGVLDLKAAQLVRSIALQNSIEQEVSSCLQSSFARVINLVEADFSMVYSGFMLSFPPAALNGLLSRLGESF